MMYAKLRKLTPFALLAVVPAAAVLSGLLAPGPSGHWTGHLSNAAVSAGQLLALFIGAVLIWRLLNVPLILPLAALATGLVIQVVANLQIAASVWRTPYGDDVVGQYGGAAFEAGHVLASLGDNVVVIAGLVFVILLLLFRRVGIVAALFGMLLSFSPPWMLPALGSILVIAIIASQQQKISSESRTRRRPISSKA